MIAPTLVCIPVGHWLLIELDQALMKQLIAAVIASVCLLLLIGIRYRTPLGRGGLTALGTGSGIVFGGSLIALITAATVLLGPYDKKTARMLIVSWSFFAMLGFALISGVSGTTTASDVVIALPGAVAYLIGSWIGSLGFRQSSEHLFRRVAITTLLCLALINIVQ